MPTKDEQAYAIDTVVRIKKTGQFAIIKERTFLKDSAGFLNYLGQIEGRGDGLYALYHDDIEFEAPPLVGQTSVYR